MSVASSPGGRSSQARNLWILVIAAVAIAIAVTITLFAALLVPATLSPSPPPQNPNRFRASVYDNAAGYVAGLNITHLAGPPVPGSATVTVKSAVDPNQCFSRAAANVSVGIPTPTWVVGETWNGSFGQFPGCPAGVYDSAFHDNITVYLVSSEELIFSTILPT